VKYTIGIDNGTTGSIAILGPDGALFEIIPTRYYLLGKAGKMVRRIDTDALRSILALSMAGAHTHTRAYVERPFTGSAMMINTVALAARAHEAVLITLESLGIGLETVDSKQWQIPILGAVKGSANLKHASMLRGCALYPGLAGTIKKHGDADSLLMAHYFHNLNK
jgi:hypothetical protein